MSEETLKNQVNSSERSNQRFLDKLQELKRESYAYLDQALNLDAAKQKNEAVIIYRKCAELLLKAISFIKNGNSKSDEAKKIHQDFNVMLKKTLDRLELLEKDVGSKIIDEKNDEYLLVSDEILNDKNASLIEVNVNSNESNATEVCHIENGVQLFYISNDGSVSTPSYPTSLSIYLFK
jgi:hypothetical protein